MVTRSATTPAATYAAITAASSARPRTGSSRPRAAGAGRASRCRVAWLDDRAGPLNEPSTKFVAVARGARGRGGGWSSQAVAAAAGADEDPRAARFVLQLLAQPLDERPEVVPLVHVRGAPDVPQQRLVVHHRARLAGQAG